MSLFWQKSVFCQILGIFRGNPPFSIQLRLSVQKGDLRLLVKPLVEVIFLEAGNYERSCRKNS